jgi:hypothetical protein
MIRKFTRHELDDLVWSKPMTTLAKEFNLSDNGLRKICIKNDIPLPNLGYWAKAKYGKIVTRISLPRHRNDNDKLIEINVIDGNIKTSKNKNYFLSQISNNKGLSLTVAKKLSNPNKLIIEAQSHLKIDKKSWNNPASEITFTQKGFLDLVVAPKNLSRALCIYDCLIKNLDILNYKIKLDNKGTYISSMDNHEIGFSFREKYRIVESTDNHGWKNRDLIPSGILSIKLDAFGTSEFKDYEKKSLEEQLPKILAKIEFKIKEIRDLRELQEERENEKARRLEIAQEELRERLEEKARIEKIAQEIQRKKDDELNEFLIFYNAAERWRKYVMLKEYYDIVCSEYEKGNKIKDNEWLTWAKKKLDWYNPLLDIEDSILSNVDKDKLVFTK